MEKRVGVVFLVGWLRFASLLGDVSHPLFCLGTQNVCRNKRTGVFYLAPCVEEGFSVFFTGGLT